MRESIKELVRTIGDTLPVMEPIYEFGALQVPGQERFADLRPLFAGKEYVGCDMREGPGVDKLLNLHNIDLPDEVAGTILMLDTMEHVEYPHKAMEEVHRVLRPGGMAVITSVMNFPIHEYPYDYWRFTPEAFRSLLKQFDSSFVEFAGDPVFPHTVVGIGFKGPIDSLDSFAASYEAWKKRYHRGERVSIGMRIRLFLTPPPVRRLGRKVKILLRRGRSA